MRIAYLTSRRVPHHEPDVQQMLHTVAGLSKAGIEIDLLAPRRWRQVLLSRESLTELAARHYNIPKDRLSLVPLPPVLHLPDGLANASCDLLSTVLADVSTVGPAFFLTRRGKYQAVYTRRWLMAALSTRLGIRTVFETYTAVSGDHLLRCCNLNFLVGLVTHSRVAAEALVGLGFPEERTLVCYNGYNPIDLLPVLESREARARLQLPERRPIVCYTGRLKPEKAPDSLLQTAKRLPEALFLLVGAMARERQQLEARARHEGLTNWVVVNRVDPARLSQYLYAADVLIMPPSSLPLKSGRTVLPMKTFLYMASGRPLVAPDLPDLREILQNGRNAVLTTPDQPDEAARAIRRLLLDPMLREKLGKTAEEDARKFTWQERSRRLADFLNKQVR